MSKEKRYTATYTMYIYAKDDSHARSKAKMIEAREYTKYPMQDCKLEQLDETPFASLTTRDVSLDEPTLNQDELPF